jgi:hypothetical protein
VFEPTHTTETLPSAHSSTLAGTNEARIQAYSTEVNSPSPESCSVELTSSSEIDAYSIMPQEEYQSYSYDSPSLYRPCFDQDVFSFRSPPSNSETYFPAPTQSLYNYGSSSLDARSTVVEDEDSDDEKKISSNSYSFSSESEDEDSVRFSFPKPPFSFSLLHSVFRPSLTFFRNNHQS